jgi:hypothetical protein
MLHSAGVDVNSLFGSMNMETNDAELLQDLMADAPTSGFRHLRRGLWDFIYIDIIVFKKTPP